MRRFIVKTPILTLASLLLVITVEAKANSDCPASIWPQVDMSMPLAKHYELKAELFKRAEQSVGKDPVPVATLRSAGIKDKSHPELIASRLAFQDADDAVISAMAYSASKDTRYLHQAKSILMHWSVINKPTGHPIDETRLEGLLWAYILICEELNPPESDAIKEYFALMYEAKKRWKFGPKTAHNNHQTHQLKMMILLDRALSKVDQLKTDIGIARKHADSNLDESTGISIDFQERNALYYHVYDLEPWLEIELLAGCCTKPVTSAFWFAANKVMNQDVSGEFVNSTAEIDKLRAEAGFSYAKTGSDFDVSKMARSVLVFSTITMTRIPESLNELAYSQRDKRLLFYKVRKLIWEYQA